MARLSGCARASAAAGAGYASVRFETATLGEQGSRLHRVCRSLGADGLYAQPPGLSQNQMIVPPARGSRRDNKRRAKVEARPRGIVPRTGGVPAVRASHRPGRCGRRSRAGDAGVTTVLCRRRVASGTASLSGSDRRLEHSSVLKLRVVCHSSLRKDVGNDYSCYAKLGYAVAELEEDEIPDRRNEKSGRGNQCIVNNTV